MPITKGDVVLETTRFAFDLTSEVIGLTLDVNLAYLEDGVEAVRQRKSLDVWDELTDSQKFQANIMGKKLLSLAKAKI